MIKHEYYHGYYISIKIIMIMKFYEIFFYNILGLWCLYINLLINTLKKIK